MKYAERAEGLRRSTTAARTARASPRSWQEPRRHAGRTRTRSRSKQSQFDATISKIKAAQRGLRLLRRLHPRGRSAGEADARRRLSRPSSSARTASTTRRSRRAPPVAPRAPSSPARASRPTRPAAPSPPTTRRSSATRPGSYGAEGFDGTKIYLDAFKDGKKTRADILAFVKAYNKQGVSKYIKFDAKGEVDPSKVVDLGLPDQGHGDRAAAGAQAQLTITALECGRGVDTPAALDARRPR